MEDQEWNELAKSLGESVPHCLGGGLKGFIFDQKHTNREIYLIFGDANGDLGYNLTDEHGNQYADGELTDEINEPSQADRLQYINNIREVFNC